jgi:mannose/fructose/N-acetylgalactosamine-specific phosphotransferase system component IID
MAAPLSAAIVFFLFGFIYTILEERGKKLSVTRRLKEGVKIGLAVGCLAFVLVIVIAGIKQYPSLIGPLAGIGLVILFVALLAVE